MNSDVTDVICSVYSLAIPKIVPVSNTQTAEAVKMVENIFRHVNIALINELATKNREIKFLCKNYWF